MAFSFSSLLTGPSAPRRRSFWRLARRCTGSFILLAGTGIATMGLIDLATARYGSAPALRVPVAP